MLYEAVLEIVAYSLQAYILQKFSLNNDRCLNKSGPTYFCVTEKFWRMQTAKYIWNSRSNSSTAIITSISGWFLREKVFFLNDFVNYCFCSYWPYVITDLLLWSLTFYIMHSNTLVCFFMEPFYFKRYRK